MGNCRSKVIDVIPDRETMLGVVDTILAFEEMLKRGQTPTKEEEKQIKRAVRVTREMKKLVK